MPWIVLANKVVPSGTRPVAARNRAVLNEPARRLPESPMSVTMLLRPFVVTISDRRHSGLAIAEIFLAGPLLVCNPWLTPKRREEGSSSFRGGLRKGYIRLRIRIFPEVVRLDFYLKMWLSWKRLRGQQRKA